MEQTDNISASQLPKVLVVTTMLLVIARLATFGIEMHFNKVQTHNKGKKILTVKWLDLTERFRTRLKRTESSPHADNPKSKSRSHLCSYCKSQIKPEDDSELTKQKSAEILAKETWSIIKDSKKAKRYVLYEFYSKDSSPCKRMDETSFGNTQVANLLERHFTPVRVTYNKNESNMVGDSLVDFRRHYKVFAFPTLVVVDQNGEMVTNLVGNCASLTTYRYLSRTISRLKATESKKNIAFDNSNNQLSQ